MARKKKALEAPPVRREYTVEELKKLPTLDGGHGHFGDVKVLVSDEEGEYLVILSRTGPADGDKHAPVHYQCRRDDLFGWRDCDAEGKPIPEIQSIVLVGREWWGVREGGCEYRVDILVNGVRVGTVEGQGGEHMWEQSATDWLWRNGYVELETYPKGGREYLSSLRDRGEFAYYATCCDVAKRSDL